MSLSHRADPDDRPRPERVAIAARRRSSCSSTSRSSSRSARSRRRRRTTSSWARRDGADRLRLQRRSRSRGRGSTTRGSRRRYDNDDIFFRVATLVVMLGVLIVALGVPRRLRTRSTRASTSTTASWSPATSSCASRRSRCGCAPRSTTRAAQDVPRLRRQHLDRPGRLDRADLPQPADRHDARHRDAAHPLRARGPALRRAEVRADAVASAPHRRALRTARHHHARRGRPRHDPRDLGRRRRRTGGAVEAALIAFGGTRSPSACGGATSRSRPGRCSSAIAAAASCGATGTSSCSGPSSASAPGSTSPRRSSSHDAHVDAAFAAARASRSRCSSSRSCSSALRAARHAVRPVPHLAVPRGRSRCSR